MILSRTNRRRARKSKSGSRLSETGLFNRSIDSSPFDMGKNLSEAQVDAEYRKNAKGFAGVTEKIIRSHLRLSGVKAKWTKPEVDDLSRRSGMTLRELAAACNFETYKAFMLYYGGNGFKGSAAMLLSLIETSIEEESEDERRS